MWRELFALEGLARGERTEAMTKAVQADIGERLLTLKEAAEVLRLSTRTVREYVKRGEIRGKIIGKQWRFRRADLDAFFENAPSEWDFAGENGDRD
jgi:excisionase family DNA binding protein